MKNFFVKGDKLFNLKELHPDVLMRRVMPRFLLEVARKYFRIEVEGIENIPLDGRGVIAPNHSGFSGFDAILMGSEVYARTGRIPHMMAHHLWFFTEFTAIPAKKLGLSKRRPTMEFNFLKTNISLSSFQKGRQGTLNPPQNAIVCRNLNADL